MTEAELWALGQDALGLLHTFVADLLSGDTESRTWRRLRSGRESACGD
jgi:hypothetical protein